MTVFVLTRIQASQVNTWVYRDRWAAMEAADTMAGASLEWDQPEGAPHRAANEYLLDEVEVVASVPGFQANKVTWEIAPRNEDDPVKSVTYFANDIALGTPDLTRPFSKTYTRPLAQEATVTITAAVTRTSGKVDRGTVLTID